MVTSANERTCLITSELLHLQRLDWTSLGECIRYLRKLETIWCTRRRHRVVQASPLLLQVRDNRIPAAVWYEQEERHTTYLTSLSSITSHHPTHTLRVTTLSLAMRDAHLTFYAKQTNAIDVTTQYVKKRATTILGWNTWLTWQTANSKNQTEP
jgi:hypothetical protein